MESPLPQARRSSGVHPSLVDIAFSLVFLFLILSTLAVTTAREAVERTLPPLQLAEMSKQQQDQDGITENKSTIISVRPGPEYFLEDKKMTVQQLEQSLATMRPPELEVRGDVNVPYGAITEVLRICQDHGIASVALTYKDSEPGHH